MVPNISKKQYTQFSEILITQAAWTDTFSSVRDHCAGIQLSNILLLGKTNPDQKSQSPANKPKRFCNEETISYKRNTRKCITGREKWRYHYLSGKPFKNLTKHWMEKFRHQALTYLNTERFQDSTDLLHLEIEVQAHTRGADTSHQNQGQEV